MAIATLRPASTVVVVRERLGGPGFDVLMVRRNNQVAFMAGAYVFPGGRVDDQDAAADSSRLVAGRLRFPDLSPAEESQFRVAAARELNEEAGLDVDPSALAPLAHWVTPEIETRRFDTRFFLTRLPAGQDARHDGGEMVALAWFTPEEATERCLRGEIMLPPPTWTTLKRLARFPSLDDLFAWVETAPIVRVQPMLFRDADRMMLTLPGDPTFPTMDGWDVPEDTRFVLQDGQWRPVPV